MQEQRYRRGTDVPLSEIERELDRIWRELRTDHALRSRAYSAGLHLDQIEQLERTEVITLRTLGLGMDPGALEIIVAFAPFISHVANSLWDEIILPVLKARLGHKVMTRVERDE